MNRGPLSIRCQTQHKKYVKIRVAAFEQVSSAKKNATVVFGFTWFQTWIKHQNSNVLSGIWPETTAVLNTAASAQDKWFQTGINKTKTCTIHIWLATIVHKIKLNRRLSYPVKSLWLGPKLWNSFAGWRCRVTPALERDWSWSRKNQWTPLHRHGSEPTKN